MFMTTNYPHDRIDMDHVIKVADFGLSEKIYSKNYFRCGKDEGVKLPAKWMAIESFHDRIFTEKTDVVSEILRRPMLC